MQCNAKVEPNETFACYVSLSRWLLISLPTSAAPYIHVCLGEKKEIVLRQENISLYLACLLHATVFASLFLYVHSAYTDE